MERERDHMSNAGVTTGQIKNMRRQTLGILDDLVKKSKAYEISDPPTLVEEYRLKLLDNTYKVLVVGEMKRGKSSFVNALIGRDILPTDVDIATCEVFRVRRAMKEAYRVRFEDGSAQEIPATQLKKYGSQGARDTEGLASLNQIIRWIEVDLPVAEFLPIGVSLLDTPGLGSLYAAHGQITQRFVPQADAVIFILDSEKPIILSELEFIEEILAITRNIFFILTKIDQYDDDHWQEVQRRNEILIKERFANSLNDIQIWPFSSVNLRQATETHEDIYLEVSYYDQLAAALQAFLFRVAGWSRCAAALLAANHYYGIAEKILSSRLAGLKVASQQFYTFQQEATERRQGFDDAWGANGKKSQELMTNIQRVTTMHKRSFVALLEPNGEIETKYRHEIDAVESSEDAKKLSEVLDESLVTELLNEWRTICEQAYDECISLLAPFIEATDELLFQPEVDQPDLVMRTKSTYDIKNDLLTMIKEANTNLSTGIQVSACFVLTIGSIAGILFPPAAAVVYAVGIPAVLAMGTWSGVQGWKNI
jgi:GTPase SAR1 family protein